MVSAGVAGLELFFVINEEEVSVPFVMSEGESDHH